MIWVCREARRPGSSPLARGLLTVADSTGSPARIIPARAGFTATGSRRLPTRPDHPRSRGVYSASISRSLACTGSSPLARGLLSGEPTVGEPTRIIPARAGFTPPRLGGRRSHPDHPRSRGVYVWPCRGPPAIRGSSPLARGLPAEIIWSSDRLRIIPARAGFTPRRPPWPTRPRDHPRSRGVYAEENALSASARGSSPLARGLLVGAGQVHVAPGIIPARAGFTPRPTRTPGRSSDHPRSRGVYSTGSPRPGAACGSSPLARGLRSL